MFCEFHRNLIAYDQRRYCQCKACVSAINFTLKIITHYGEFTSYQVRDFRKLIGKDIIVAHQLLKNNIEQHEYWLVTESLLHNNNPWQALEWNSSTKQTENGDIAFHFTQLTRLKNNIIPESLKPMDLSKKIKNDINCEGIRVGYTHFISCRRKF
ncbi:MAG: DUF2652 domain-containing protein [Chitinophagales bacterium]|nr:DUF2652 domain-containing protein [Chitinophagales bacterium]